MALVRSKMQTASSAIRTQVANFNSYDDNRKRKNEVNEIKWGW